MTPRGRSVTGFILRFSGNSVSDWLCRWRRARQHRRVYSHVSVDRSKWRHCGSNDGLASFSSSFEPCSCCGGMPRPRGLLLAVQIERQSRSILSHVGETDGAFSAQAAGQYFTRYVTH